MSHKRAFINLKNCRILENTGVYPIDIFDNEHYQTSSLYRSLEINPFAFFDAAWVQKTASKYAVAQQSGGGADRGGAPLDVKVNLRMDIAWRLENEEAALQTVIVADNNNNDDNSTNHMIAIVTFGLKPLSVATVTRQLFDRQITNMGASRLGFVPIAMRKEIREMVLSDSEQQTYNLIEKWYGPSLAGKLFSALRVNSKITLNALAAACRRLLAFNPSAAATNSKKKKKDKSDEKEDDAVVTIARHRDRDAEDREADYDDADEESDEDVSGSITIASDSTEESEEDEDESRDFHSNRGRGSADVDSEVSSEKEEDSGGNQPLLIDSDNDDGDDDADSNELEIALARAREAVARQGDDESANYEEDEDAESTQEKHERIDATADDIEQSSERDVFDANEHDNVDDEKEAEEGDDADISDGLIEEAPRSKRHLPCQDDSASTNILSKTQMPALDLRVNELQWLRAVIDAGACEVTVDLTFLGTADDLRQRMRTIRLKPQHIVESLLEPLGGIDSKAQFLVALASSLSSRKRLPTTTSAATTTTATTSASTSLSSQPQILRAFREPIYDEASSSTFARAADPIQNASNATLSPPPSEAPTTTSSVVLSASFARSTELRRSVIQSHTLLQNLKYIDLDECSIFEFSTYARQRLRALFECKEIGATPAFYTTPKRFFPRGSTELFQGRVNQRILLHETIGLFVLICASNRAFALKRSLLDLEKNWITTQLREQNDTDDGETQELLDEIQSIYSDCPIVFGGSTQGAIVFRALLKSLQTEWLERLAQ